MNEQTTDQTAGAVDPSSSAVNKDTNPETARSVSFGSVVDRLFPGDKAGEVAKPAERSVVTGLPGGDALNVSRIISDEAGNESLAMGGSASLADIAPVPGTTAWTAEQVAVASVRGMNMNPSNPAFAEALTAQLSAEAAKPPISLPPAPTAPAA